MALCRFKDEAWEQCIAECEKVLKADPTNVKARSRAGHSLLKLGRDNKR